MKPEGALQTLRRAVVPLLLLAALVAIILRMGPADTVRGDNYPPVEVLSFQRVVLTPEGITATILNDGPDPVTIAQVAVDDAFWAFQADAGTTLDHLQRTRLTIPYPWVHGETHVVKLMTATGMTFEHEIAVAVETPSPSARMAGIFVLIGLYVGVIPVAIGLLWYPLMSVLGRRGLDFVLALTIGLLLFLFADSLQEGFESALALPASYQGLALLVLGAVGAYLSLDALGAWLKTRRAKAADGRSSGWVLALLMAIGIGLHNFAEGLAIGAAFALGEAALGTLLIIGFMLHNATEGLAIVAPLGSDRVRFRDLVWLGLIGGAPTIGGALLGGLFYSPVLSVLFLAMGAGAIAQVLAQIARQVAGQRPVEQFLATAPALAGLLAGFSVMYATGMIVG
ncbi:MAG: ZIP family metal transporter [Vicinamibacterales bacterium]